MTKKRKTILTYPLRRYQGTRPPLGNQGGVEKWTTGSKPSRNDLDGNQNRQCSSLGPPESTPTNTRPKMKEKRQKSFTEQNFSALENPSETCTTERTHKLW